MKSAFCNLQFEICFLLKVLVQNAETRSQKATLVVEVSILIGEKSLYLVGQPFNCRPAL